MLKKNSLILGKGGEAYIKQNIQKTIRQNRISIWLKADFDILIERVLKRPTRPFLQKKNPEIMQ
ncbi:shikimate kinase [Bartonella sp. JB63]|uniref:shikimate kinase n=1 Tax=unclassified Bartonella TaxID=2645622 RepID=UPI003FA469C7